VYSLFVPFCNFVESKMRAFLLLALFVVLSVVYAAIEKDGSVLVLNDNNFAEALQAHNQILVEFYAPWCGHCKNLAPEWSKAATKLEGGNVPLAKVDATESEKLAKQYEIKGFPTIKYFKNGKPSDYNGGRTEAEIVSWVNKKSGAAAKTIATAGELEVLIEGNDASVLGVFSSADSANARAFMSWAGDTELAVPMAITTSDEVRTQLGITGDTIVVHRNFDEPKVTYNVEEGVKAASLNQFVVGATTPLISEFTQQSAKKIFGNPITKHALFFTNKAADHHASTYSTFSDVAKNFRGKALFVNVPNSEDNKRVMDFFDIKSEQLPVFVMLDMDPEGGNMKKYPYTGDMVASTISSHVDEVLAGKAVPFLKSEPVLPEDTAGDVAIVKGKSFQDLVIKSKKDVLLEFYAPWCGHCKKLAPTWDELGAKYKGSDKVLIAKMDATANEIDVPGIAAKGFPTIFFIPADRSKAPVKYEGGRELSDFVSYLDSHSSHHHQDIDHDHAAHDHAAHADGEL
jgi:protein disulfide-isomerase A1